MLPVREVENGLLYCCCKILQVTAQLYSHARYLRNSSVLTTV
jgi:hypothetical protein